MNTKYSFHNQHQFTKIVNSDWFLPPLLPIPLNRNKKQSNKHAHTRTHTHTPTIATEWFTLSTVLNKSICFSVMSVSLAFRTSFIKVGTRPDCIFNVMLHRHLLTYKEENVVQNHTWKCTLKKYRNSAYTSPLRICIMVVCHLHYSRRTLYILCLPFEAQFVNFHSLRYFSGHCKVSVFICFIIVFDITWTCTYTDYRKKNCYL